MTRRKKCYSGIGGQAVLEGVAFAFRDNLEIAKSLGLNANIKIVSGCHDQIAAMTGASAFESDEVMDGTGTVECVPVIMEDLPKNYSIYKRGFSFAEHINGRT